MASVGWMLSAIFAPLLAGLLSLLLPRPWITPRVLLALGGPVVTLLCLCRQAAVHGPLPRPARLHAPFALDTPAMPAASVWPWLPELGLDLSFYPDGLGLFFALLVAGIGSLIILYARGYFGRAAADLYRFYPTMGLFTTAMLGLVLADHTLLTLLFWEMTAISSFLLIGWDRANPRAVRLAMQAFFTTGLGGLGLLGGLLLLGVTSAAQGIGPWTSDPVTGQAVCLGLWRWTDLLAYGHGLNWQDPVLLGAFALLLLGAATKSAQYPFHYWLPGAMAAPTPVSAFLHSATMVKAGVFLIARLLPVFGASLAADGSLHQGLWLFPWALIPLGGLTMALGAVLALGQHDLKRLFAYTTVSQLGLLVCLYGLGSLTYPHHDQTLLAIDLDITQIASHAFYKAPLFILAGALGHVLSRQLPELRGAFYRQPWICGTLLLAGYALAAGPGTISFQAKELFLYAIYHARTALGPAWLGLMALAVLAALCNVGIFVRLLTTLLALPGGYRPTTAHEPHDHAADDHHPSSHDRWAALIWLPGLVIVLLQYLGGLFPSLWNAFFLPLESHRFDGTFSQGVPSLVAIVTHPSPPLFFSLLAMAGGVLLGLSPLLRRPIADPHDRLYPGLYHLAVHGGGRAFRVIQTGHLNHYVGLAGLTLVLFFSLAFGRDPVLEAATVLGPALARLLEYWPGLLLGLLVCATALALLMTEARVVRVMLLGACGLGVVGLYLVYQAPDLALTQLMFEFISVILFVLVLRLLPAAAPRPRSGWLKRSRLVRAMIAGTLGLAMGWLTLIAATSDQRHTDFTRIGEIHARSSNIGQPLTDGSFIGTPIGASDGTPRGGGGTNIVNVILVDFRGFDTLGEITVLALAAIGVWSMLPGRRHGRGRNLTAEGVR